MESSPILTNLFLVLLGAALFSLGRCAGGTDPSSCGAAGQAPCLNEYGFTNDTSCNNGTYYQKFFSYKSNVLDRSGDPVYRALCLPMPNGTYKIGGPCDPSHLRGGEFPGDRLCVPDKGDGVTPVNQTVWCNWVQDYTKPGNDSYDKLAQNPYAYDSAVAASVGTCIQFPADRCGQAYGPCSAVQIGSITGDGRPSPRYQECPDSTGCPSGYYCEGLIGASKVGYPSATCLEIDPDCGKELGGPCCPGEDPKAPHCPGDNLYCQVRGWMTASINDTYCLEIGSCGHLGQPPCNHTVADTELGGRPGMYVDNEKDAQADLGGLRCEPGLYDNDGSIRSRIPFLSNGTCAANPADCGTLGKVACALPRDDDCCTYYLTCDKGLCVLNGTLSAYLNDYVQWWSTTTYNITMPVPDLPKYPYSQMVSGVVDAAATCQTCPQGESPYDFACKFGVPDGIRPTAGGKAVVAKPIARIARTTSSSCSNAGQPPCTDETGGSAGCNNGTYSQIFYSYGESYDQQHRTLCLPMPNGTYTAGGPCDPKNNKACTRADKYGVTPDNLTMRCASISMLTSNKPGNDSYNRLMRDPYANDTDVFPASRCGQAYGPCSSAQIGSYIPRGMPSDVYQECPDNTRCPSGYYCEGLRGAKRLGYPWATCLKIDPKCGTEADGPCCPGNKPDEPHCPAENLYCQVRGFFEASINETYCLEIGSCGREGKPVCNHTTAGRDAWTYVDTEKKGQADVGSLRCAVGLYDSANSIMGRGKCTKNPPDCGTLGKVACALPFSDDSVGYTLTCDKGLYAPKGELRGYSGYNITTSVVNVTLPPLDPSTKEYVVYGDMNATMTCQRCPQGKPEYDFACDFGVPEGIRPKAGTAST